MTVSQYQQLAVTSKLLSKQRLDEATKFYSKLTFVYFVTVITLNNNFNHLCVILVI